MKQLPLEHYTLMGRLARRPKNGAEDILGLSTLSNTSIYQHEHTISFFWGRVFIYDNSSFLEPSEYLGAPFGGQTVLTPRVHTSTNNPLPPLPPLPQHRASFFSRSPPFPSFSPLSSKQLRSYSKKTTSFSLSSPPVIGGVGGGALSGVRVYGLVGLGRFRVSDLSYHQLFLLLPLTHAI